MMELRRGGWGGLGCAANERVDVGDDWCIDKALETVGGGLRRGGGLQRRRRLLGASLGGAGDPLSHPVGIWEHVTEGSGRRQCAGSMSGSDGENVG